MEEKKISVNDLSERTGMALSTIYRYLNGKRQPLASNLKILANALDVPVSELVDGDEG